MFRVERTIFRTRMSRLNWAKKETPTNKNPNQRNGQTAAAGTQTAGVAGGLNPALPYWKLPGQMLN